MSLLIKSKITTALLMQNFAGTRLTTCAMQHKEGKVPAVCVEPKQEWIQYK